MKDRLKALRKELGMSQEEFGEKIGSARNTIANYEIGRRAPSNAIVMSICREFNVNYLWLTEGEGDMFNSTPQDIVDELAEDFHLDNLDKKIIVEYLKLDEKQRAVIKDYLKNVFL